MWKCKGKVKRSLVIPILEVGNLRCVLNFCNNVWGTKSCSHWVFFKLVSKGLKKYYNMVTLHSQNKDDSSLFKRLKDQMTSNWIIKYILNLFFTWANNLEMKWKFLNFQSWRSHNLTISRLPFANLKKMVFWWSPHK